MKTKTNNLLLVVTLIAYWVGLCNASAFYDPGAQRWLNRDPIGEPSFELLRSRNAKLLGNGSNFYGFVSDDPIGNLDPFGLWTWSDAGKAIWTAAGYIVPGGEFPAAFEGAPEGAKILIETAFKKACEACMCKSDTGNCPVCDDYERIKALMGS